MDAAVVPGVTVNGCDGSRYSSLPGLLASGFKMDLIDESRLGGSASFWLFGSIAADENDRFRDGDRNDDGDSDEFRSCGMGIDVMGANRFSSVNDSGMWFGWLDEWDD